MLPTRDGRGQFDPVLPGYPDGGDADGHEVMVLSAEGQERQAGRDPPVQDSLATSFGIGGQHLPGQAPPVQVTDGEGDLGAPEVHAQDYLHLHPRSHRQPVGG